MVLAIKTVVIVWGVATKIAVHVMVEDMMYVTCAWAWVRKTLSVVDVMVMES